MIDKEELLNNKDFYKSFKNGNYRIGHGNKKIKSSFGKSTIKVPRDREGSFEPALIPKRHNIIEGLENIIISFYAKGMSRADIEEQIREMYDFEVSTSTYHVLPMPFPTKFLAGRTGL